jgi:hypothetical protein
MKQILLNTAYLPPVSWFCCLAHRPCFIDLSSNFQKQSFRNRTIILSAQGLLSLVIPVIHQGKQPVIYTEISYREQWVRRHIRSIETAYRNAPYFDYYWPEIAAIILKKHRLLYLLNQELFALICGFCQINLPENQHIWTETPVDFSDYRERIHPKRNSGCSVRPYLRLFTTDLYDPGQISILDLLFNKGPETGVFLIEQTQLPKE